VNCPNFDEAILQVRLESTFKTNTENLSLIKNSTCQFAFLLYSTADMKNITFDGAELRETYIESIESNQIEFTDTILQNITTIANSIIVVENSAALQTFNAQFLSANKVYFSVSGSSLTFENTVFDNKQNQQIRAGFFKDVTLATLKGSTFQNLVYLEPGGALDTLNSNIKIDNCTFFRNQANIGAGVALR
jgi:hypothetical protein